MINLKSETFSDSAKVYFWGCNIGGQLTNNGEHVLDITASIQKKELISPKGCFAQKFAEHIAHRSHWHKYKDYDYFYDVWSNIHYGYVGLSVGFDEKTLLGGADLAQIIDSSGDNVEDTGDDKISIKIGFALYYKYGKYAEGLTSQDILDALDSSIMTESKSKHVCLEK